MLIEVLKSKIHRAKVTASEIDYIGSIAIDKDWIAQSNLIVGEKVHVLNINNGERFVTYVIEGKANSNEIIINGPAARKVQVNDIVIILSYALLPFEEAKKFKPTLFFPKY